MLLGISLIIAALSGLTYGIVKKNKRAVVTSVVALIIIAVMWLVYSYLYSLNPY